MKNNKRVLGNNKVPYMNKKGVLIPKYKLIKL